MFFDDSRPDRQKRARRQGRDNRTFEKSPIPAAKSYEIFTKDELLYGGDRTLVMDTESYPNYFLAAFKCIKSGKVIYFEDSPESSIPLDVLTFILHRFTIVGFNSKPYDFPMIAACLEGVKAAKLKEISNEIIANIERPYSLTLAKVNHIDIIEVAPLEASLKIYGGRIHTKRMQELPFHHTTVLTKQQAEIVRDYCINDLDVTQELFEELLPHIKLREEMGAEYGQDLRSKSDAQVAEAIIVAELEKLGVVAKAPKWEPGASFKYKVPEFVKFKTEKLQSVLETVRNAEFVIGENGSANTPDTISNLDIRIGNCVYRMGNGGLHSSEKCLSVYSTDDLFIIDRDVASYYPNIILNQGLFPKHLGEAFLKVYRALVNRRLKAKAEKIKVWAEGLKIAINGIFGKLGNKYSKVYSPDLVTQVTVTGQLCLLMLIEMIELVGIRVVSANTDGIVIACPKERYDELNYQIIAWEECTGFVTEETRYKSLHCRDVNNYIAVKLDGECKTKGVYSEVGSALNSRLSKNPETLILADAVKIKLSSGVPVRDTIYNSRDIRRFVTVRTVKGGGEKSGVYLGKAIRWYYAKDMEGTINYIQSGNNVPKSEGAKPCMILPDEFPDDVNLEWYIEEAEQILYDLGVKQRVQDRSLI